MLRVHCFGFSFTPKLIPTLFLLIGLTILLSLGLWQCRRADEKKQLQNRFQSHHHALLTLKNIPDNPLSELQYRPIQLTGHYDNAHSILLDNKILHHQVGYEVLTPFIPKQGNRIVLVNRGWIPQKNRQTLPYIQPSLGKQTIKGLIKIIPKTPFVLSNKINQGSWPLLMQALDLKKASKAYGKSLYPFIVLLSPTMPGGFEREWQPIVMTPAKHLGYAVQWFALALTLVIIYLCLSIKRGSHGKRKT